MIFTMVAVAVSGYLLIESAPDFSNYALLSRSQDLDDALADLRRAVASQPCSLYTTLGDNTSDSTEEFLRKRLEVLTIPRLSSGASSRPPFGPEGSEKPSFLSTVPSDPYTPHPQWYDQSTQQGLYWSRSFNVVKDPTFAPAAVREAFVEGSHDVFFTLVPTSGKSTLWKVNPLGFPVPTDALLTDSDDLREPRVSPDGSRLLYVKRRTGNSEIWSANSADGQLQTKITSGTGQVFDTPRWTPLGDQILYRNLGTHQFEIKGLTEKTRAYRFPYSMEQVFAPAWSPSGRYLAYVAQVGGEKRLGLQDFDAFVTAWEQNGGNDQDADQKSGTSSSRLIDPALIRPPQGNLGTNKLPALPVTPAWSTGSDQLIYVADNGIFRRIDLNTLTIADLPPAGGIAGGFVSWLPRAAQGSTLTTSSWLLFARPSSSSGAPGIFRRQVDDKKGTEYPVADSSTAPEGATPADVTSMAVSVAGTHLAFPSGDGKRLYSCATDGADRGQGRLMKLFETSAGRIESPEIGPVRSYWSYPPANVTMIDASQPGRFDVNSWRDFVRAAQDFDGDNKYGAQWLRVEPPARADSILFDNGKQSFLVTRTDPTHPGGNLGDNIEPCWSPRAQTWVGRESSAPIPGERPVNLFKVPFTKGSATTVRITTGLEAAISPDDRFVVVSQYFTKTTTFPPDRTLYPIENMDLKLFNTAGAVDPKPKVLTPDTPNTQDREPAWSPDGRYIYYQREVQEAPSLATHGSSIYRVTVDGAVQTEVQAMTPPEKPIPSVTTRMEYYSPAVSPDGTRLAMIGRERLRATVGGLGDSGDVISETLFVKDLITGVSPKAILRFAHPNHPKNAEYGYDASETYWSLDTPNWTPDGEEIVLLRYQSTAGLGAMKFPRQTIYSWDPNGNGIPYFQDLRNADGTGGDGDQEIIRVLASDPAYLVHGRALHKNYDVLVSTKHDSPAVLDQGAAGKREVRVFHPRLAPGAMVFQRILTSDAQASGIGASLGDLWYVLSGFVRTSPGTQDLHAAQIMLQVLDGSGLLVDQARADPPAFRVGVVDVGALQWTRFSQAINFGTPKNPGPFTFNLVLFSTGGVGSYADFTGLMLERAFDKEKPYPTKFSLGWSIFSPNQDSDPRVPEGAFFQR
ncbi:MAG: PD40 domain-containing protein [Candidatus Wallbacteria bacterium]|nr:PD40 domain-containing protein [Candidatus Wallbacteria bacterium]